jgi:hypothetical protein
MPSQRAGTIIKQKKRDSERERKGDRDFEEVNEEVKILPQHRLEGVKTLFVDVIFFSLYFQIQMRRTDGRNSEGGRLCITTLSRNRNCV